MNYQIYPIISHQYQLAESPVWDDRTGKLYWADLVAGRIACFHPENQAYHQWDIGEPLGSIVLHDDGNLVVAAMERLYYFNLSTGEKVPFPQQVLEGRETIERFNDSKADAHGRLWLGSASRDLTQANGKLYCVDADGGVIEKQDQYYIANGISWSLDNRIMYHADSWPAANRIYAFDFSVEAGELGTQSTLIQMQPKQGCNDGITIDRAGYIWAAYWDGHCLRRISPKGEIVEEIQMPAARMTSCVFGGENHDTLYVTSCSQDVGEDNATALPAGQVFAVEGLPCGGAPLYRYRGWSPAL